MNSQISQGDAAQHGRGDLGRNDLRFRIRIWVSGAQSAIGRSPFRCAQAIEMNRDRPDISVIPVELDLVIPVIEVPAREIVGVITLAQNGDTVFLQGPGERPSKTKTALLPGGKDMERIVSVLTVLFPLLLRHPTSQTFMRGVVVDVGNPADEGAAEIFRRQAGPVFGRVIATLQDIREGAAGKAREEFHRGGPEQTLNHTAQHRSSDGRAHDFDAEIHSLTDRYLRIVAVWAIGSHRDLGPREPSSALRDGANTTCRVGKRGMCFLSDHEHRHASASRSEDPILV